MSHSLSILPADVAITFAIQFVIVIFLFVAFLLLVVKFFKLSYRALAALVSSLSFSLPIRLISLSIATWLFPELPKFILFLLFNLFSFFFIDLPKTLLPGLKAASGQCLATDPGVCLAIVSDAVYRSWLDVITPFFSKVDSYNVSVLSIVLFFTSAIVSSLLIEYLVGSSGGQFPALRLARQLPQLWETIPQPRRNGIFLVLILAAAGYLSLASVIAIPSLKSETLPDAVAPDRLRAQLEEASFTEAQMASLYPDAILGATVDLAVLKQRTDSFSAFLASYANAQLQERDQLQSDWSALRQHYLGRQTELVRAAVKTYELDNIGRKGSREQIQHFIDVDANFRTWRSLAEEILANCRTAVTRFDNETRRLSQAFALLPPPEQPVRMPELLTEAFKNAPELSAQAKSACRVGQDSAEVPRRQEFGSYLGPFGSMAFWLLKTESLPFVLITGLLGFGLLGAGCSTFVRYRERQADALAAEHVGGVIIRGTSAAVVVFLGVYGGLAIFSSSATEPNAYAIFFLCLVAAVFSEEAWDWAHHRFKTEFGKRRTQGKGTQGPSA